MPFKAEKSESCQMRAEAARSVDRWASGSGGHRIEQIPAGVVVRDLSGVTEADPQGPVAGQIQISGTAGS